jgi:hypothetical protein
LYPRYQVPMHPSVPPQSFHPYTGMPPMRGMMTGGRMGPMGQMGMRQSGGGLLSRLFGRFNQTGAAQGANALRSFPAQSAIGNRSLIQTLTNPASINQFLSGTQKVLNTAQQAGPLIKQYGPIVKNLPAMWKLYRGLKDAPDLSNKEPANNKKIVEPSSTDLETITNSPSSQDSPSPSKPKLYI